MIHTNPLHIPEIHSRWIKRLEALRFVADRAAFHVGKGRDDAADRVMREARGKGISEQTIRNTVDFVEKRNGHFPKLH